MRHAFAVIVRVSLSTRARAQVLGQSRRTSRRSQIAQAVQCTMGDSEAKVKIYVNCLKRILSKYAFYLKAWLAPTCIYISIQNR